MRRTTHPKLLPLVMLRLAKDVTQAEIGDRLGRTQGAITNWETGKTRISLQQACAYAAALGYSLEMSFTPSAPAPDGLPDFDFEDED